MLCVHARAHRSTNRQRTSFILCRILYRRRPYTSISMLERSVEEYEANSRSSALLLPAIDPRRLSCCRCRPCTLSQSESSSDGGIFLLVVSLMGYARSIDFGIAFRPRAPPPASTPPQHGYCVSYAKAFDVFCGSLGVESVRFYADDVFVSGPMILFFKFFSLVNNY